MDNLFNNFKILKTPSVNFSQKTKAKINKPNYKGYAISGLAGASVASVGSYTTQKLYINNLLKTPFSSPDNSILSLKKLMPKKILACIFNNKEVVSSIDEKLILTLCKIKKENVNFIDKFKQLKPSEFINYKHVGAKGLLGAFEAVCAFELFTIVSRLCKGQTLKQAVGFEEGIDNLLSRMPKPLV